MNNQPLNIPRFQEKPFPTAAQAVIPVTPGEQEVC